MMMGKNTLCGAFEIRRRERSSPDTLSEWLEGAKCCNKVSAFSISQI
jgi:hypothetical protein